MPAALLRLLGLASQPFCTLLARTALLAVNALCDFGSPHRAACLEAMAVVAVVAFGELAQCEVMVVLMKLKPDHHILGEAKKFAADVALTLLEAAAQHSAPPPQGTAMPIHVTGVCSWLPIKNWTFPIVSLAISDHLRIVSRDPDVTSASSIRRKVVGAAMSR